MILGNGLSEMVAIAKLADPVPKVSPTHSGSEKPMPADQRSATSGGARGRTPAP